VTFSKHGEIILGRNGFQLWIFRWQPDFYISNRYIFGRKIFIN